MKLKFLSDSELEIVTDYDAVYERPVTENQAFVAGTVVEVDITDVNEEHRVFDMQFGDGSMAYNMQPGWFQVVEGEIKDLLGCTLAN